MKTETRNFFDELLNNLAETIYNNTDLDPMEIGDRVIPWDGSSMSDMLGNKLYVVDEPFVSTAYWIIISNNEKSNSIVSMYDKVYQQDLIIAHPETKQLVRTCSSMVKHV